MIVLIFTRYVRKGCHWKRFLDSPSLTGRVSISFETASHEVDQFTTSTYGRQRNSPWGPFLPDKLRELFEKIERLPDSSWIDQV